MATEKPKKEKKIKAKDMIPEGSIWQELGIYYYEDIPKYHIDGVECTKEEREHHVAVSDSLSQKWLKGKVFKKLIKESAEEARKK